MPRVCHHDDDGDDDKSVTIHTELFLLLGQTSCPTSAQKVLAAIRLHAATGNIADVIAAAVVECERLGFSRLDSQLPLS